MFSPHEALWDQNIVNRGDSWQHLQEQGLQAASAGTRFAGSICRNRVCRQHLQEQGLQAFLFFLHL
jgi:hypothetical protein